MEIVDRKSPNLSTKKSGKRMTREEFLHDVEAVNGSYAARRTKVAHLKRLDYYCNKIHGMSADETLELCQGFHLDRFGLGELNAPTSQNLT